MFESLVHVQVYIGFKNRSSLASLLVTMGCFHIPLRFSSQRWHIEIFD